MYWWGTLLNCMTSVMAAMRAASPNGVSEKVGGGMLVLSVHHAAVIG